MPHKKALKINIKNFFNGSININFNFKIKTNYLSTPQLNIPTIRAQNLPKLQIKISNTLITILSKTSRPPHLTSNNATPTTPYIDTLQPPLPIPDPRSVGAMRARLAALLILATVVCARGAQGSVPVLRDLSQLQQLQQVMRQAAPGVNITGVSAVKQGPCVCGHGVCSCCSRILLNLWKQKACVNVTYDPDEFAFTAKVSMNDHLLYTRTVSGKSANADFRLRGDRS